MMTIGLMLKAYDQMSAVVSSASGKSLASLSQVQEKFKHLSDQAEQFGRATLANGMIAAGSVAKPLQAFAQLEDATTSLKVAMMDGLGGVPEQFHAINQQAIELGNILPGTTADFVGAARALVEQGTGLDTILNGGLKSASYLSVLLKMPASEAAEMVAKLREAYGLADNELEKMADLTQRARFAFGMTPEDIKIASSYSGATQNALGLTGLENAKKLLAMQGLGAGVSLEGSSWGTNFATLLTRTAESKDRLAKTGKEMKAINEEMKVYGINLQFFNDKGSFMGLDNLVKQLEKTKVMSQVDQLNLFKKLFGVEAGRPAQIIANKGFAGYQDALAKMERQASLQQRIELSLTTLKNKWDALTGTFTNSLAAFGEPIANFIGPAIVVLNGFVGGPLMDFIGRHQTLIGVVGVAVLIIGLLAIALGTLGLVAGTTGKFIGSGIGAVGKMAEASRDAIGWLAGHRLEILRLMGVQRAQIVLQNLQNTIAYRGGMWKALQYELMTTRYRMLEAVAAGRAWIATSWAWARANAPTLAGLRGLAAAGWSRIVSGFWAGTAAVKAFSLALLANPIVWVVALIAGGAFLIFKYWKPISAFFSGLWAGLKAGVGPLSPAFQQFARLAMAVLWPILWPLRAVWNWLATIFDQVEDTGGAARKLGVSVGQGIASAILWVGRLSKAVFELPGKFFDAGADIVKGLWRGIESLASKPVESIKKIGTAVAGAFKGLLGIRSPSRVFMGFGDNIGQGAAIGIEGSLPRVQKAVGGLAGAALGATRGGAAAVGPVRMPVQAAGQGGGGSFTVHFSPTIQVTGGGDVGGQVKSALADGYREFEANMRRFMAEQQRRGF
jgi:TP901 family phage tail tape measure protein